MCGRLRRERAALEEAAMVVAPAQRSRLIMAQHRTQPGVTDAATSRNVGA